MEIVKKLELCGWFAHPKVECMVEVEFDPDSLARTLGEKAYRNKSKKTRALNGLIKVTVRPTRDRAEPSAGRAA
jgi:hypothetical protein